ncbi:putative kinase [Rhizobium sp. PP-F2F-G48]|uniref:AAA family ATPase n=1 Tax=Rhizobium sp. PP-F2F-G48 TaxID=2135651 RepID=UPI0010F2AA71|nr:AAA family ATPase [Rhizobium sp. PP-F2F-G48]TCM58591.1 putative kinase [Rhizobium sp. PP-F2F-G48]
MSILIVFSGLPATGKTTIATSLCRLLTAVHVGIDSIEHALQSSRHPMADSPLGYVVAQAVAADNLRLGHIVVADCVNPVKASRKAWRSVAAETGAIPLDVRLICSDVREHRRRAESRQSDVIGLIKPSWDRIFILDDEPWDGPPDLTLDTATSSPEALTAQIAARIRSLRPTP